MLIDRHSKNLVETLTDERDRALEEAQGLSRELEVIEKNRVREREEIKTAQQSMKALQVQQEWLNEELQRTHRESMQHQKSVADGKK